MLRPVPPPEHPSSGKIGRKLAWFVAIAAASALLTAAIAYTLRALPFL